MRILKIEHIKHSSTGKITTNLIDLKRNIELTIQSSKSCKIFLPPLPVCWVSKIRYVLQLIY